MRLLWVLLASLLCAAAVVGAGFALKSVERNEQPWRTRMELAKQAFAHDAGTTRKLLDLTCERDQHIDRLLSELSAGARETDAEAQAKRLGKLFGGDVALLLERAGAQPKLMASTSSALTADLFAFVRGAVHERRAHAGQLYDACVTTRGTHKLWVLRTSPVETLIAAHKLAPSDFEWDAARAAATREVARVRPLRVQDGPLIVQAIQRDEPDDRWFATLAILSALAFCFGGALAAFLTRKRPIDDAVLTAIENAAERVAQGDLSSQIGLTVNGRADLTLRKFDRMTNELRETRGKLAEAERAAAWQDIARRIAHEIKNPLSPIKMAIETLRKAHEKKLSSFDEIFEESTHAIREEVERMEHIVREFSEFARLPKARPGAFNLLELVHETAALYTQDGAELTLPEPGECLVHADREQLAQVLINLLTNAYDAVRTSADRRVRIAVENSESTTRVLVEDSGPGVPDSDRERIFDPYVTGKTHGTGLGLSIVRRIVQDHGGSIVVEKSTLGGARFVVTLPRAQSLASMP